MSITCDKCRKSIVEAVKYMDWLSLLTCIDVLHREQSITTDTWEYMYQKLMTFGSYAKGFVDENDKRVKEED